MKRGSATTITTPPFAGSRASTGSGTLRGCPVTPRAPEWLKITGAFATSSVSIIVASLTWLRSTSMPMRFISRTTSIPKGLRPSCLGVSVAASAQGMLLLWVSVM